MFAREARGKQPSSSSGYMYNRRSKSIDSCSGKGGDWRKGLFWRETGVFNCQDKYISLARLLHTSLSDILIANTICVNSGDHAPRKIHNQPTHFFVHLLFVSFTISLTAPHAICDKQSIGRLLKTMNIWIYFVNLIKTEKT